MVPPVVTIVIVGDAVAWCVSMGKSYFGYGAPPYQINRAPNDLAGSGSGRAAHPNAPGPSASRGAHVSSGRPPRRAGDRPIDSSQEPKRIRGVEAVLRSHGGLAVRC